LLNNVTFVITSGAKQSPACFLGDCFGASRLAMTFFKL
jgi:hypothetical protein